jgi:hypothetical protein
MPAKTFGGACQAYRYSLLPASLHSVPQWMHACMQCVQCPKFGDAHLSANSHVWTILGVLALTLNTSLVHWPRGSPGIPAPCKPRERCQTCLVRFCVKFSACVLFHCEIDYANTRCQTVRIILILQCHKEPSNCAREWGVYICLSAE